MATLIQTFDVTLPLDLFNRLRRVRSRYAGALKAAGAGDYSRSAELRSASKLVGRILADEARKSPEERGGLRMLDIFLAMDRVFPELRGWNDHHITELQQQRQQSGAAQHAS